MRLAGSRSSSSSIRRQRKLIKQIDDCLPTGAIRGEKLGSGTFGVVFELTGKNGKIDYSKYVLKASNIESESRRDTFDREIYFLQMLSDTRSNIVPMLLSTGNTCDKNRVGIQILERFDGSAKDLGIRQARSYNLPIDDAWLFKRTQLRRIVALGKLLDNRGIIHGDAKLANLLSDKTGRRIVFADFGFSGFRTAAQTDYGPLQGFTRSQFQCPGRSEGRGKLARLVSLPNDRLLWRRWNSVQLMLNLLSHDVFVESKSAAKRLSTSDIRRLFGFDRRTIADLIDYCPGAADVFRSDDRSFSSSS